MFDQFRYSSIHSNRNSLVTVGLCALVTTANSIALAAPPYFTGHISDGDSQTVEMPKLPGGWQRTVAWMAPEGSQVEPGDLIVRLEPGDLIAEEETMRIRLEEVQLSAEASVAENELAILDAETAVLRAESNLRIARLDAEVPDDVRPRLNFERDQLSLENAENALVRANQAWESTKKRMEELIPVTELNINQVQTELTRIQDAIKQTEIQANRSGLMIYAENPFTHLKIFPGQTLQPSVTIALVSNQDYLQFTVWVHEADIRKIGVGTLLTVTPDAIPEQSVEAETEWISNHANTRSDWGDGSYFEVTAKPTEPLPEGFLPGMSVVAEVL